MSCCGQKRRALRDASRIPQKVAEPPAPSLHDPALLQHLGDSSLVVRGPVTGQCYLFGARGTALAVDKRDALPLIASGRFTAARAAAADH
jgi:hypothetical protein